MHSISAMTAVGDEVKNYLDEVYLTKILVKVYAHVVNPIVDLNYGLGLGIGSMLPRKKLKLPSMP